MPSRISYDHLVRAAAPDPRSRGQVVTRPHTDRCEEPCTPRCPACGGLKCVCRPRFFPGQLLTDKDLNGLQQYVVDKNRLHNTYLHGWGVACGLEVTCDGCDPDHVIVRTGYAVSPCGNDIVVCGDQSVDICALINACEPRDADCEDPYDVPPRDCTGGVKRWVLAVCYDERPTRGITAQLGAGDTSHGRCACGGSRSCGCNGTNGSTERCGCGSSSASQTEGCGCGGAHASSGITTGRKGHKPQCEPTQTCETYRFVAYPAPVDRRLDVPNDDRRGSRDLIWAWLFANRSRFGPMIERVLCCVTRAMELRQDIREGRALDRASAVSTYTDYAATLAEFAADFAIHGCSFVKRTRDLNDDAKRYLAARRYEENEMEAALSERIYALDQTWLEIVSECICSALLPACPAPPTTDCVPLAVVTITDGDCRVEDICNWSERKLLITWPTISYWLSWLPWDQVTKWIARVCCGTGRDREAYRFLMLMFGSIFGRGQAISAAAATRATVGVVSAAAVREGPSMEEGEAGRPVREAIDPVRDAFEAPDLLRHMLGDFDRLRTEGAEATGEPMWAEIVARLSDGSILAPPPAEDPKVADLTSRLDTAEETLRRQASEIASLKRKGGREP